MQEEFLDQSILLAKTMQDNFTRKLKRKDREVKQAGFIVLHQTFMPSVLIETGFLTYKPEGEYLNSSKGQQEMGEAIANAILDYKNKISTNSNTIPSTPKTPKPEVIEVIEEKVVEKAPEVVVKKEAIIEEVAQPVVVEKAKAEILFKVQIVATTTNLGVSSENFKGLNNISKEPYKNLFRYMYGQTKSYDYANKLKEDAKLKGYKDAYIVAYKNGDRIAIAEALKYASE